MNITIEVLSALIQLARRAPKSESETLWLEDLARYLTASMADDAADEEKGGAEAPPDQPEHH